MQNCAQPLYATLRVRETLGGKGEGAPPPCTLELSRKLSTIRCRIVRLATKPENGGEQDEFGVVFGVMLTLRKGSKIAPRRGEVAIFVFSLFSQDTLSMDHLRALKTSARPLPSLLKAPTSPPKTSPGGAQDSAKTSRDASRSAQDRPRPP